VLLLATNGEDCLERWSVEKKGSGNTISGKVKRNENSALSKRIKEYLQLEAPDLSETDLKAIEDIKQVGPYHGFAVWQAGLVFAHHRQGVWVIPEPVMNYYLQQDWSAGDESAFGDPEDAVIYHIGFVTMIRAENQEQRLVSFEPPEAGMTGDAVIRVGQNTKVSVLSERLIRRVLEQGWVELETVGAGAVNQAVKAVARARQASETEGFSLVIAPKLVKSTLGSGGQTVVRLTVMRSSGDI